MDPETRLEKRDLEFDLRFLGKVGATDGRKKKERSSTSDNHRTFLTTSAYRKTKRKKKENYIFLRGGRKGVYAYKDSLTPQLIVSEREGGKKGREKDLVTPSEVE